MPGENLTRVEAQERAACIRTEAYEVALDLSQGDETYRTETVVRFAATPGSASFIDVISAVVHSVTLNGAGLDPKVVFADSRIQLPDLSAHNVLKIVSDQRYTNTGEGLHRFVDPADGEVYLYSQFEVPDSRRMFPVFEQPDLKATFRFTVTAPARWQVVSNQPTPAPTPAETVDGCEMATWAFGETPIMSSYITALIAGPYHVVRSELTNADGRIIPLGVFCRASLAEYLDADYVFEKTRQGFAFFSEQFDYPYPFEKYDQLFVPEFNMGAMENIGAVTFTESYIFRSKVTDAMRERRVVTILHELAHMWFGDLVTMRWWNDLWLNESFAEYMSTLATADATEWTDAWTTFVASEKSWAYRQDQLPSTHPIVAPIRDLEDVMVNFDGITYAKGASVLKQLVAWVGQEPFMRGVHDYFVKHAYGNTELPDLLVELERQSGRDLADWSKKWLETAGVNTLRADFTLDETGRYTSFAITQSATADYPTIRPHRIAVGLYRKNDDEVVRDERFEIDVAGVRTELPELVGALHPELLLLNDDDLSYTKIRLDRASLDTAAATLGQFSSSLARGLIWGALWDMTRDGELSASRFVDVALAHLGRETASTTLRTALNQLLLTASSYVAPERRDETLLRVADGLWQLAVDADEGSDAQFQFVRAFAQLARSDEQLDTVLSLLDSRVILGGLDIDTDLGWELLTSLAAGGRATRAEIEAALEDDRTATGQQSAAHAFAALPTAADKAAAWSRVFDQVGESNLIIRATGLGFGRVHDRSLLTHFIPQFFDALTGIWDSRSYQISEEVIDGFYPSTLANAELLAATEGWLAANPDAASALRRMIVEHADGIARALRVQAADQA